MEVFLKWLSIFEYPFLFKADKDVGKLFEAPVSERESKSVRRKDRVTNE